MPNMLPDPPRCRNSRLGSRLAGGTSDPTHTPRPLALAPSQDLQWLDPSNDSLGFARLDMDTHAPC